MVVACVLLAGLAYGRGGIDALLAGARQGAVTFVELIPLLALAFACAGLVTVVASKELVARWLGAEAGFKGILIGGLAGALMPGGPFIYYPVAATFMAAGADIGTVISFVVAKNLWSVSRLPLELALLGPKLTFARYGITLVIPPLAGLLANLLLRGQADAMRAEIRALQSDAPSAGASGHRRG